MKSKICGKLYIFRFRFASEEFGELSFFDAYKLKIKNERHLMFVEEHLATFPLQYTSRSLKSMKSPLIVLSCTYKLIEKELKVM